MSREIIVLCPRRPGIGALLERVGIRVGVRGDDGLKALSQAAATQVFDAADRMLLVIRDPVLVEVPGEAERLLGIEVPSPVWWVEIRAAAGVAEGEELAARCAGEMIVLDGGIICDGTRR
ncbi:hypothetical protein ACFOY4_24255 [Actinomadura syzygii]|uniref:Uncharacterized protein n=1 Tax=Actinomadura syzygii TaxID=1427538 RepID=A0A5D0UKW7_9ACTN|nr:hypothetical protein [Actinomadura syzygii]TYC18460.1 hypothetical protein FXF65_01470 [Actinomadura syzygii]